MKPSGPKIARQSLLRSSPLFWIFSLGRYATIVVKSFGAVKSLGIGALVFCIVACVPYAHGKRMDAEGRERDRRIAALEKATQTDREILQQELLRAKTQLDQLQKLLDQATRVVTRNSADLGAQMQDVEARVSRLEGKIEETRQTLATSAKEADARAAALTKQASLEAPVAADEIPVDRVAHFAAIKASSQQQEWDKMRALVVEYLRRYPQDVRAGEAQYSLGMANLKQDRPAKALGEFRKVVAKYGTSEVVDDTLLAMAEAFYKLQACTDAKSSLQTLLRTYPKSILVPQAKSKMREYERSPRGYCTS